MLRQACGRIGAMPYGPRTRRALGLRRCLLVGSLRERVARQSDAKDVLVEVSERVRGVGHEDGVRGGPTLLVLAELIAERDAEVAIRRALGRRISPVAFGRCTPKIDPTLGRRLQIASLSAAAARLDA
ncbi:hypothetical protein GCM10010441_07900 [Kitasatospora paracochleata]